MTTLGWGKRSIGPYLRRDKSRRIYGPSFRLTPVDEAAAWFRIARGQVQWEPTSAREVAPGKIAGFRELSHWSDWFKDFRECRPHIISRLHDVIRPEVTEAVMKMEPPVIGVHVRLGDFKTLPPSTDFASVGATRTPFDYFVSVIDTLRTIAGTPLPVMLFSDGRDGELAPLLKLPNVRRAPDSPDLVDLLHLARSRFIVASAGSSFSMWAGFLSDAALLLHPDHIHAPVRPLEVNVEHYEGPGPVNVGEVHSLLFEALS